MKDVIIKPEAPSTLLLDRHADYIAAYGSKKDDYVSKVHLSYETTLMLQYTMQFKMIWQVLSDSI